MEESIAPTDPSLYADLVSMAARNTEDIASRLSIPLPNEEDGRKSERSRTGDVPDSHASPARIYAIEESKKKTERMRKVGKSTNRKRKRQ